jgi:hypothetical protein
MGGALYSFFVPYHPVHFEAPNAIARAVLFRDPLLRSSLPRQCGVPYFSRPSASSNWGEPIGGPVVEGLRWSHVRS